MIWSVKWKDMNGCLIWLRRLCFPLPRRCWVWERFWPWPEQFEKRFPEITKAGALRRLSLGPKKSLGLERFFVKEIQTNAHWAGRDSSKLELPPLFGPRSLEDRSKLLTCFVLYRRNLAWSLRNSKKVCDCYINDNHSHLQEFLLIFCNCFGRIAPLIFSNS